MYPTEKTSSFLRRRGAHPPLALDICEALYNYMEYDNPSDGVKQDNIHIDVSKFREWYANARHLSSKEVIRAALGYGDFCCDIVTNVKKQVSVMELVETTIKNMQVLYEKTKCQYFDDQAQSWIEWRSMMLDDVKQKWSETSVGV